MYTLTYIGAHFNFLSLSILSKQNSKPCFIKQFHLLPSFLVLATIIAFSVPVLFKAYQVRNEERA